MRTSRAGEPQTSEHMNQKLQTKANRAKANALSTAQRQVGEPTPVTADALLPVVEPEPVHELDQAFRAFLARCTKGQSPYSLIGAYGDWLIHLMFSPGKLTELAAKAARKTTRFTTCAARGPGGSQEPCIEPLPQDRRFSAPEWQNWPHNLVYQSFLLYQQWWHNATSEVRGVTRHHEHVVNFATRQWLDVWSPSNFLPTNPEVLGETVKTGSANLWRGLQNWIDDFQRISEGRPPAGTERFRPGREVAVTPGKVVFRNHLIELIQYEPATASVFASPVLIVPAWIMKYYILDLSPGNSLVKYLVEHGHTVFLISWRNPDAADRNIGMDDYLSDGVMAAVDAVAEIVPGQKIQAVGYCLGGTLLAIAAAWMAREGDHRLQTVTLLASQVDFSEPGELSLFIDESALALLDDLMSAQGYLDGKQMAGAFALLNQRDLVFSRLVHDYLMGRRKQVTDLEAWNADATRMPFRQHSHYLHSLYLRNAFADGHYRIGGRPVVVSDVRVPMFCLGTQRDTVSPWRSVYMINLLADTEVTFCLTTGGHNVGIVNPPGPGVKRAYQIGVKREEERYVDPETWQTSTPSHDGSWWPAWEGWLRRHAGKRRDPPLIGGRRGRDAALEDAPGRYILVP